MPSQASLSNQRLCNISITISGDSSGEGPDSTYHPGDLLTGTLRIHHGDGTIIDDVTLSLEGQETPSSLEDSADNVGRSR